MTDLEDFKVRLTNIEKEVPKTKMSNDRSYASTSDVKTFAVKYKCYLIVVGIVFLFLLIIKPKLILKTKVNGQPRTEVDLGLFLKYWIIFSLIGTAGMYYYINVYCKKKNCKTCM